jgi:hypothetical protein
MANGIGGAATDFFFSLCGIPTPNKWAKGLFRRYEDIAGVHYTACSEELLELNVKEEIRLTLAAHDAGTLGREPHGTFGGKQYVVLDASVDGGWTKRSSSNSYSSPSGQQTMVGRFTRKPIAWNTYSRNCAKCEAAKRRVRLERKAEVPADATTAAAAAAAVSGSDASAGSPASPGHGSVAASSASSAGESSAASSAFSSAAGSSGISSAGAASDGGGYIGAGGGLDGGSDVGEGGGGGGGGLEIGTKFTKYFDGHGDFEGTIVALPAGDGEQLYMCHYDGDDDEEELSAEELQTLMGRSKITYAQVMGGGGLKAPFVVMMM